MSFADNFLRGLQQGQYQKRQQDEDAKDDELRKLNIEALKHQQKQLDLEGRWKAFDRQRAGAKEAAAAHEGLPIEQLVQQMTMGQFGQPQDGELPARGLNVSAMPTAPGAPSAPINRKSFAIPGSEEFGIPGYSVQPKSIEEQTAAMLRAKLMDPVKLGAGETLTVPLTGQTLATGGQKPRNFQSKNVQAEGFSGMANFDPETGQYFAPGTDQPLHNVKDAPPQIDPTVAAIRDAQLQLLRTQQAGMTNEQFDRVQAIGQDFDNASKDYVASVQAYQSINAALSQGTAAGDMAGIFAFMKSIDKGSTVRETEYANAQNAAGVPERIRNMYNNAKDGQILSADQRADFRNTAKGQFQQARTRQGGLNKLYTARAKAAGVPAHQVVIDYDEVFGVNDAAAGGMVPMKSPDGRDLMVPAAQVEEAKSRGAVVVQ